MSADRLKNMKISDLPISKIKVGLQLRSLLNPKRIGTIVKIDKDDDYYCYVKWNDKYTPFSGFFGNDCECEVVLNKSRKSSKNE